MKPIKMLGLAALAALMAMAFVGASSAMAEPTVLCAADEESCAERNTVTHVHEETLSGAKAKLLAGRTGTVECDALFLGDVLAEKFTPLVIHGDFTYTNCRLGGTNCTATEESEKSKIEVLISGHESAEVTGEGKVRVRCGIFINCVYNGEGLNGTATGPLLSSFANGDVTITGQPVTKESGICPTTGELDISTMPLGEVFLADELLVCVRYRHIRNGAFKDGRCDEAEANGAYILLVGPTTLRGGDRLCLPNREGLYEDNACTREVALGRGAFEIGTITTAY